MKLRRRLLCFFAFFVMAIPHMFITGDAGAATYKGDGAVPNAGYWGEPSTHTYFNCLDCHGVHGDFTCSKASCKKGSYLMTGHKNVLRRVSPGAPWKGADGNVYNATDPYGSGSIFDWNTGTVLVAGAQPPKTLLYIFGGWMSPDTLNAVYNAGFTGELFSGGSYDCARCHTTGYRFSDTGPLPALADTQFSRIPTSGPSQTSSWYLDGIQCERCHRDAANEAGGHACYAADGTHLPQFDGNYMTCRSPNKLKVAKPTFENATALCIECHRQESLDPNSNIVLSTELKVSDGGPPYGPFFFMGIGQSFLNSPHAKFTGALSQKAQNSPDLSVIVTGTYDSSFRNSTPGADFGKNLGCAGCHDVHQSTVEAVNAPAPITSQCGIACHTTQATIPMRHPTGAGTPLPTGTSSDFPAACGICHMPEAYHFFRIKVDASYSTFPTEAQFNSGQTTANTASDGIYTNAVWVDLDLACGQCHNATPGNTAHLFSNADLATKASGMHGGSGYSKVCADCHAQEAANLKWSMNSVSHTIQCSDCHTRPGVKPVAGTTVCNSCHGGSGPGKLLSQAEINGDLTGMHAAAPQVDNPPTAAGTLTCGWTASVHDTSSDDIGLSAVTVTWGDGFTSAVSPVGSTVNHTYAKAGTYAVSIKAVDTKGQIATTVLAGGPCTTAFYSISGNTRNHANDANLGSVGLVLRNFNTSQSCTASPAISLQTSNATTGAYSFANLKGGRYGICASKAGYTFPVTDLTVGPTITGQKIIAN